MRRRTPDHCLPFKKDTQRSDFLSRFWDDEKDTNKDTQHFRFLQTLYQVGPLTLNMQVPAEHRSPDYFR